MRRRRVADVGDRRPARFGWGRHAPAHQHHLFGVAGIADHRCRIVRKHTGHRRQIANIAVHVPEQAGDRRLVGCDRIEITDVDGPPLVRIVADFWPDRLLSDVRPVCADKVRWPRWCSLRTLQAHGRHSWCQCNLRKLARIDRSVLLSTASCKFVGNPPSNLARRPISDQAGMAATGWLYTPPDIINCQAMRANLLAKATATSFGGFRSSSEASHGVGL